MKQLFEKFRNVTAVFGIAFVLSTGSAAAATLDQFIPVSGGATISGTGSVTLSSTAIGFFGPGGTASGGDIAGPVAVQNNFLTLTAAGSTIVGGSFASTTSAPFLTGSFEDARADTGILSFLFVVNGGSAASSFGSHVIYTLSASSFTADTFAGLINIEAPETQTVGPVSFAITEAAVIPLPAGLVLLLTALGTLGLARMRRKAA